MEPTRDKIWTSLYDDISFRDFSDRILPKISFKEGVNDDVSKTFVVIKDLLDHSFFKYEFIDVAVGKALHTFEMALKLRYKEVTNEDWNVKKPLKQLLDWFEKNTYLEAASPIFISHVRNVRNYFSYPDRYGFGGVAALPWISIIVDLINDLYEDPALRSKRNQLTASLTRKINEITNRGAVMEFRGNTVPVDRVLVIFTNNKFTPPKIHLLVFPVFDLVDDQPTMRPILIEAIEDGIAFNENVMRIGLLHGEPLVRKARGQEEIAILEDWQKRRTNNPEFDGRMFLIEEQAFEKLRRAFHFISNHSEQELNGTD